MWRAFFLALGGTLCVIGVESMVLDHAVLAADVRLPGKSGEAQTSQDTYGFETPLPSGSSQVIHPPEWGPWSLISTGAVISLYAIGYKGGG